MDDLLDGDDSTRELFMGPLDPLDTEALEMSMRIGNLVYCYKCQPELLKEYVDRLWEEQ